jgi:4-hydroxyphenylpyruvate dioxygenase-like putative hemolysin
MSNLADLGLGPIDQVAYIVEDMERAIPRYEALFGPFQASAQTLPDCTVRGASTDLEMKMAVSSRGPIEIELIQPVKGESPWSEHLATHGEGLHHVRFRVTRIDAKLEELAGKGFETLMYKRFGPEVAFAYLETPEAFGGHIIELLELP